VGGEPTSMFITMAVGCDYLVGGDESCCGLHCHSQHQGAILFAGLQMVAIGKVLPGYGNIKATRHLGRDHAGNHRARLLAELSVGGFLHGGSQPVKRCLLLFQECCRTPFVNPKSYPVGAT